MSNNLPLTNGNTTIEFTSSETTNYLSKKKTIDIVSSVEGSSSVDGIDINNYVRIDVSNYFSDGKYFDAGFRRYLNIPNNHDAMLSTIVCNTIGSGGLADIETTYCIVTKWKTSDIPYVFYKPMILWNYTYETSDINDYGLGSIIDKYEIYPSFDLFGDYITIFFTVNIPIPEGYINDSDDDYNYHVLYFAIQIDED